MKKGKADNLRSGKLLRYGLRALVLLLLGAAVLAAAVFVAKYKVMAYQGDNIAYDYLHMNGAVNVAREQDYIYFDGPGEGTALVFYPGAGVEPEAYAPIMEMLAEAGTDGYLMRMPLNFAFLGAGRFGDVYDGQKYSTWLLAGHSLGGVAAAWYAKKHSGQVKGLVFLASYSITDLRTCGIPVLSVTATEDGVIDRKALEEHHANLPTTTTDVSIEGGNHSGFGSYGEQDGDNKAKIPQDQQWVETLIAIQEFEADISD